ncbi:MAG: exonuclease domain-containing protein [Gemmatimonadaceae bacterium]|jgi:DNA polymerase-3 subunit epsilon|nr:exonuclease domain-containing protein [Gemmatimonadaceae bacterium]
MLANPVTPVALRLDPAAPLARLRFAVVDVETTGTRADGEDRVTEIAVVPVDGLVIGAGFSRLVNPGRGIPWFITQLTGIDDRMVADAPTFAALAQPIAEQLTGRIFVAHNVAFDWRFVSSEFARAGVQLGGDTRLCTVRLARRLVPELPRRSLDHLAQHFGVGNAARHRALGDARATAEVLVAMLRRAQAEGIASWGDLMTTLAPRRLARTRVLHPPPVSGA